MATMETLSEAVRRLTEVGYDHHVYPVDGQLVCSGCGTHFDPSTFRVDEIVRFEGASDPDDQAILFALDSGCGHRGLYATAYGAAISTADVDVLIALPKRSYQHTGDRQIEQLDRRSGGRFPDSAQQRLEPFRRV